MGWKNTTPIPLVPDRDLNPFWKWQMGWLPDANIATPVASGTYRIHAFDQPALEAGKNYALRVVRDPSRVYWFSYRASITNEESLWSNNGLEVRIGGESVPATGGHTTLFDMTPGSRGLANIPSVTNNPYATLYDAPLAIGRTYSDNEANLHVTPVKKAGTAPESLDVVLNYGPFPGNSAPTASISPATLTLAAGVAQTFTATASDGNGDALSYYWEFDDPDALGGTAAGNTHPDARLSTQGSHTWTRSQNVPRPLHRVGHEGRQNHRLRHRDHHGRDDCAAHHHRRREGRERQPARRRRGEQLQGRQPQPRALRRH